MTKPEYNIRPIRQNEIDTVADMISTGYYNDEFFIWSVGNDNERHSVVAEYYKIYLTAAGCVAYVAQTLDGKLIGAAVWLPHDTDASIYEDIDRVTGVYCPQFRAVSDRSHDSEPPIGPFYQLVGFVVKRELQGMGLGVALLKYQLDRLDKMGIPTYLEASTPYFGGGVYGKFGYLPVGELMVFADTAVLYPLWRPAGGCPKLPEAYVALADNRNTEGHTSPCDEDMKGRVVRFGCYDWRVLEVCKGKTLLLSENVIDLQLYHDAYESVTWEKSSVREYLNTTFLNTFTPHEQLQILDTQVSNSPNPWFGVGGGEDTSDKIFLLSVEEVVKYLGGKGQPGGKDNFYIDDQHNNARSVLCKDGSPTRWMLRTPGSFPYLVVTVTIDGRVAITGDFVNRPSTGLFNMGVRPALWRCAGDVNMTYKK